MADWLQLQDLHKKDWATLLLYISILEKHDQGFQSGCNFKKWKNINYALLCWLW